jgi:hypothetical protein
MPRTTVRGALAAILMLVDHSGSYESESDPGANASDAGLQLVIQKLNATSKNVYSLVVARVVEVRKIEVCARRKDVN